MLKFIEEKSLQQNFEYFEEEHATYSVGRITALSQDWDTIVVYSLFFQPKWCLHQKLFEDLFKQLYELSSRLGTGPKSTDLFTIFFALYAERANSEASINVESLYKEAVETLLNYFTSLVEKRKQELSFIDSLKKKKIKPTPILKIFQAVPINNESKELLEEFDDLLFQYVLNSQFSTNGEDLVKALDKRNNKEESVKTFRTTVRKIEKTVISILNQLTPIYPKIPPYLLERVLKSIIYYCHSWVYHKEALKNLFFEFVESFKTLPTNMRLKEALLLGFLVLHTEGVNEKTFTPVENASDLTLLIAEKPFKTVKGLYEADIRQMQNHILPKFK